METMTEEPFPSYGSFLVRSLVTLVIPQGYTLSITGSFAVAVRRYGFPLDLAAWGFVAGAVAAFVVLSIIERGALSGSIVAVPTGLRALINIVPLFVVLGVVGVVALIGSPWVGFPVAGFTGAAGYVVLLSAFMWLVTLTESRR
jgi:hypothetical protein